MVNNDFTISYNGKWYQLAESQPPLVCRKDRVLIEIGLNGDMHLSLRDKYLHFQELPERPKKVKMMVTALAKTSSGWKPPADHPWRKPFIFTRKVKVNPTNIFNQEKL